MPFFKQHTILLFCCILSLFGFAQNQDKAEFHVSLSNLDSLIVSIEISIHRQPIHSRILLKTALEFVEKNEILDKKPVLYRKMGNSYYYTDAYDEAISYYIKSLKFSRELDDKTEEQNVLNDLAAVFIKMEEYDEALEYIRKTQNMTIEQTPTDQLSIAGNLGVIFKSTEQIDSAFYYYKKALRIAKEIDNPLRVSIIQHNIGNLYFKNGNNDMALAYIDSSRNLATKINNKMVLANNHIDLGRIYFQQNQYVTARKNLEKSLTYAREVGLRKIEAGCYEVLRDLHEKLSQYNKALAYSKKYQEAINDIINEEKAKQIEHLKTNYEVEQREQELLLLTKENELKTKELNINEAELERTRLYLILLIGAIILSGLFIATLVKYLRMKETANKELKSLNSTISAQSFELKKQSEELQQAYDEIQNINANLERIVEERTEKVQKQTLKIVEYTVFNAHKIRGPLATIMGLVNLVKLDQPGEDLNKIASDLKATTDELDENLKKINQLLSEEEDIEHMNMSEILKKINMS